MKKLKKLTALLLCITLMLSVAPIVSAETSTTIDSDFIINQPASDSFDQSVSEPYIISELTKSAPKTQSIF